MQYDASSETSQRIAFATSCAVPGRCSGSSGRQAVGARGIAAAGVDLGVDDPGAHGVHADRLVGDLAREADREHVDGGLRRGVVDVFARRAVLGRGRRDVDDVAAAAAVPRRHAPDRLGGAQEAADDVDRHHPLQAWFVDLVDARLAVDDPGVVDQHRQWAELADGFAKQPLDVGSPGSRRRESRPRCRPTRGSRRRSRLRPVHPSRSSPRPRSRAPPPAAPSPLRSRGLHR